MLTYDLNQDDSQEAKEKGNEIANGQQYIQKDRIFGQIMHIVFGDLSPIANKGSDGVSAGAWVPGLKATPVHHAIGFGKLPAISSIQLLVR